jgi:bacterioferritin-associated ferredoxin
MLVCQCNGVSDRQIRKAVRKGATNASQVGMRTGAATCCGGCLDSVKAIIRSESSRGENKADTQVRLPIVPS